LMISQGDGSVAWAALSTLIDFIPVGIVVAHPTETVPANWLECDGSFIGATLPTPSAHTGPADNF